MSMIVIIERKSRMVYDKVASREFELAELKILVDVAVSGQFIGWLVALGDGVKVVGPESVVERMREEALRLMGQYGK